MSNFTYVLSIHDVAALAYGRDTLVRVDHYSVSWRRHRPRFAISSARVGRDRKFHTVGYAYLPSVTYQ